MTGLLLVVVSFASQATLIGPEAPAIRDAGQVDGTGFDRRLLGEITKEMQRTGSGVTPGVFGIEQTFVATGNALNGLELREELDRIASPGRPRSVRSLDDDGPDVVKDALNSALRATRDALFEGGDTASFSLAGIDLSVTVRGDRRGISVNGHDLLAANQHGAENTDVLLRAAADRMVSSYSGEVTVRQLDGHGSMDRITLAEIRRFFSEPMTIVGIVVFLGGWVVLTMVSSRRN